MSRLCIYTVIYVHLQSVNSVNSVCTCVTIYVSGWMVPELITDDGIDVCRLEWQNVSTDGSDP
jgi:hypothetical protein